jgi:hypothetical protein
VPIIQAILNIETTQVSFGESQLSLGKSSTIFKGHYFNKVNQDGTLEYSYISRLTSVDNGPIHIYIVRAIILHWLLGRF